MTARGKFTPGNPSCPDSFSSFFTLSCISMFLELTRGMDGLRFTNILKSLRGEPSLFAWQRQSQKYCGIEPMIKVGGCGECGCKFGVDDGIDGNRTLRLCETNSFSDQASHTGSTVATSSRTFVSKRIILFPESVSSHPRSSCQVLLPRVGVSANFQLTEVWCALGEGSLKPARQLIRLLLRQSLNCSFNFSDATYGGK